MRHPPTLPFFPSQEPASLVRRSELSVVMLYLSVGKYAVSGRHACRAGSDVGLLLKHVVLGLAIERGAVGGLRLAAVIVVAGRGNDAFGGNGGAVYLAAQGQGALAGELHVGEGRAVG